MTKYYVEVHAPMDQVFVGPFESHADALAYAAPIIMKRGHDAYVIDESMMGKSIAEYGEIPIQTP